MSYPDKMIRGIASKDFIDADGRAASSLFQFSERMREDGHTEASINWYDNEEALNCIMKQSKANGDYQFKFGAAIVSRSWIDTLMNKPAGKGVLCYERAPLVDNKYHGNLLRRDRVISKQIKSVISASIAMGVEEIIRRNKVY